MIARPHRAVGLLAGAAIAVAALISPSRADAFERQWHAGADLGYTALLFKGGAVGHGFGSGLHLTYGLNDSLNLLVEANTSYAPSGRWLMFGGGVGIGYVIDILQWVPYIGAVVGSYDIANVAHGCGQPSRTASCHSAWANLEAPFGIDYSISRSLSVGVGGRYQLLLSHVSPVSAISAFARIEVVWGY